jgi:ElaA protein
MGKIIWQWHTYQQLSTDLLYAIIRLRQEVFGVEQSCAYLDLDGRDQHSLHLTGHDADGELVAYLRLVEPGKRFPEPSIGQESGRDVSGAAQPYLRPAVS